MTIPGHCSVGSAGAGPRILLFLAAGMMILAPGIAAEGTASTFFNDWTVDQTHGSVHIDLPPPVVLPAVIAGNALSKGSYTGPCPIGTNGAPQLRNPELGSKALCRGACGPDCPAGRCTDQADIINLPSLDGTGTCTYRHVTSCPTHQGCQEHDACYDWCESNGHTSMIDGCHLQCNQRCYDTYGRGTCTPWADIPGRVGSLGTTTSDWWVRPQYSPNNLLFSDPPVFIPARVTVTTVPVTSAVPDTPAPATLVTPVPSTLPSVSSTPTTAATKVPATTAAVTKGVAEPDVSLTILYTGSSQGVVASDVQATVTCGSGDGGGESRCRAAFPYGTTVSLVALPEEGARLVGWYGACSGTGVCTVVMNKDKTVTAEFGPKPVTHTITSYQDYCSEKYPGSTYNAAEGTCEYTGNRQTSGSGSRPTLVPLQGECCPHESCSTRVADATGGSPPYHFSSGTYAGGGAPPMGMGIGIDGYLTGTAPAAGTYSFSVCVTDLSGNYDCGYSSVVVT